MGPDTVSLTYQLREDELYEAHRQIIKLYMKPKRFVRNIFIFAAVIAACVISILFLELIAPYAGAINFIIVIPGLAITCYLLRINIAWLRSYFRFAGHIKRRKWHMPEELLQRINITFTQKAIFWKTPSVESEIEWRLYTVWESDDYFFFLTQTGSYFPAPKSAFAGERELQAFKSFARTNLGEIKQ